MSHSSSAADAPVDHLRLIVGTDESSSTRGGLAPEEFDALADLFLDEPQATQGGVAKSTGSGRAEPAPVQTTKPHRNAESQPQGLELVVTANVPRPAGGWLVAHSRARAATLREDVLLVRSDGGLADAQLVGPGTSAAGAARNGTSARRGPAHTMVAAAGVSQVSDEIARRVTRVCVLSGAGETGAIAAYSAIKGLVSARERGDVAWETLGVCFVGASREKALAAHRALRRACESFLGVHVEFAGSLESADHGACRSVWRSSDASLAEALREGERAAATPAMEPRQARKAPVPTRVNGTARAGAVESLAEAQMPRAVARDPAEEAELAARCPEAPAVRFLVDGGGGLHLRVEDMAASAADAAAALLAASAWAERHHETLDALARAAGAPALRTDKPVCHLTTRDARRVRPYLDTSLRLDVVAMPARPGEPVRVALN